MSLKEAAFLSKEARSQTVHHPAVEPKAAIGLVAISIDGKRLASF
jgi:hypothetical protein